MKELYNQKLHEYSNMSGTFNIVSGWTHQIKNGQQPSSTDLQDHLTSVHNHMQASQKKLPGTVATLMARIAMNY